jgi:hypothetical protein
LLLSLSLALLLAWGWYRSGGELVFPQAAYSSASSEAPLGIPGN